MKYTPSMFHKNAHITLVYLSKTATETKSQLAFFINLQRVVIGPSH